MQRIHQSMSSTTSSAASERITLHHNGYAQIRAKVSSIVRRSRAMDRS